MSKTPTHGPATAQNLQGLPQEAHGGSNLRGAGGTGTPQNTNTKGNGAQKRQQRTK